MERRPECCTTCSTKAFRRESLSVFRFVTFRAAFASITALFMCVLVVPGSLPVRALSIGQHIREEA